MGKREKEREGLRGEKKGVKKKRRRFETCIFWGLWLCVGVLGWGFRKRVLDFVYGRFLDLIK